MKKYTRLLPLLAPFVVALSLGVVVRAGNNGGSEALPFDEIDFFFEFNFTEEDLGCQLNLGADPWRRLRIIDPNGKTILDVSGKGTLKGFGLSSLFFESNEPNFREMSMEEILELFPEGEYEFLGLTTDKEHLYGTVELTHDLPDPSVIMSPSEDDVIDPDEDLVVTWKLVTTPAGIEIQSYEVIVTNDEDPRFRYDVILRADATSLTVPAEFFEPDTEYELEILAKESSGNQTITVLFFATD